MTDVPQQIDGLSRRTLLKASTVGAGAAAMSGAATAGEHDEDEDDDGGQDADVDEPDGFEVEILAGHAPFPDELSSTFALTFTGTDDDEAESPIGAHHHLDDESTIIFAEVTWEAGGASGWHRHPGVALVSMVEGEVEVVWERDCLTRTYSAGEGFFDPGLIHNADNPGDEPARAYVLFYGIPDGAPATEWVEPVDC